MKLTQEMIDRIKARAEELHDNYEYVGLRIQDEEAFELGELDHCSHIWADGDDTGEELNGVCVLSLTSGHVDWAKLAGTYFGDHAAIVCGFEASYGEDLGELVIADPEVVEIIA